MAAAAVRNDIDNHSDEDRLLLASRDRQQAIEDWFNAAAEVGRTYQDWMSTTLRLMLPQFSSRN